MRRISAVFMLALAVYNVPLVWLRTSRAIDVCPVTDDRPSVSLSTATPPTIHADAAIKAGPALLRQLDPTATTSSLANQVEICLVWEHVCE